MSDVALPTYVRKDLVAEREAPVKTTDGSDVWQVMQCTPWCESLEIGTQMSCWCMVTGKKRKVL